MNPLARKRWNRFRQHRRGFISCCLLISLYLISLCAELICNDRPIAMRLGGSWYFPAFRYYTDDDLTGSGLKTRPDYKLIEESEWFRSKPGNTIFFPPFRHGPYEIIRPETLRDEEIASITLRRAPLVGSINITPDFKVARYQSAEPFLGDYPAGPIDLVWRLTPGFQEAIAQRFKNEAAPAWREVMERVAGTASAAEVSLSEYMPRQQAPRDVRVTFRDVSPTQSESHLLKFSRGGRIAGSSDDFWSRITAEEKSVVLQLSKKIFEGLSAADPLKIGNVEYQVQLSKNDVQWPYPPVKGHWLGIDNAGRDVLARILYGLRTSMTFGLLLVVISMGLGIILGAVQGYYGGRVDLVGQRLIEIWSTIPFLYVMILLGSIYGRSFSLLLFCYGVFNWIGISYYVRAEFLRLRNSPFVDAARCLGLSSSRIMFRHILPNSLTPLITFFPFSLVGAIGSLAMLDYLGFGLPPPVPSWGELLQQAQAFRWAWWLILYPSLALFVVMLLGVFVGEAVRDAYDPKPVARME